AAHRVLAEEEAGNRNRDDQKRRDRKDGVAGERGRQRRRPVLHPVVDGFYYYRGEVPRSHPILALRLGIDPSLTNCGQLTVVCRSQYERARRSRCGVLCPFPGVTCARSLTDRACDPFWGMRFRHVRVRYTAVLQLPQASADPWAFRALPPVARP